MLTFIWEFLHKLIHTKVTNSKSKSVNLQNVPWYFSYKIPQTSSRYVLYKWCYAGYTLFANYNKTWTKQKFCRKNCKFAKHDENHAIHYSLIVQSFAPESDFFSSRKKSLRVCHGNCSPGKTRGTKFREKTFREMLWNTYTVFTVRTNFAVSSWFRCGSQIVCSPL